MGNLIFCYEWICYGHIKPKFIIFVRLRRSMLAELGITVKGHADHNQKTAIGYTKNSLVRDYLLSQYTAAGGQVRNNKPIDIVYVTDQKTGIITQQE